MKYTYYIFSDCHGEYEPLQKALKEAGFNGQAHQKLVCLGDFTDRGKDSAKIWQFLLQYENKGQLIRVKGNHDAFFADFIKNGKSSSTLFNMLYNGLDNTIYSFMELYFGKENAEKYAKTGKPENMVNFLRQELLARGVDRWLERAPLYYETKHMIFSHAGIDPGERNWKDTSEYHFLWDIRDTWSPCDNTDKLVIIGHHHARELQKKAKELGYTVGNVLIAGPKKFSGIKNAIQADGDDGIYILGNKIGMDALTNLTHKVNVLVVEDEELGG